jgi:hypothetical protein
VRVKYDRGADAAGNPTWMHLDFDADAWLIGIEILAARHRRPPSLLEDAEKLG